MTIVDHAAPAQSARLRRCVLIVHGVGQQRKSDTLLYIGSPLVSWLMRWAHLFYGRPAAEIGRVELSFVPYDVGHGDRPPMAVVQLPEQDWYFAEAWWAGSTFHPDLLTMLYWSFVHLLDILAQMLRNTVLRAQRLVHPADRNSSSQPAMIWQLVDLLNCVLLAVGYAITGVLGYVLLVPLMILAQIPIEAIQDFILFKILDPLLTASAGEFRMYLDDELQAANVRRRIGDAARVLMRQAACDELIVVAHSEGCVVSLGMLTDPVYADVAARTRKLLTFGAGLNKSWLLAPKLDRLFTPLVGNTLWTDFWASYDPVPAGPLDPSRHRLASGAPCSMTDVYQPTGDALVQVGAGNPPISEQVSNAMFALTDHGGYFVNEEQVVMRLAAEISAANHTDAACWPPSTVLFEGVRKRRERVSALALWRDVVGLVWLVSAVGPWFSGWLQGVDPWQPLANVSPNGPGAVGWLVGSLVYVRDSLPAVLAPISGVAGMLLGLPAFVGVCALLGVLAWAVYSLVEAIWWRRWDASARESFLEASVHARQEQLKASAVAGSPV